MTARVGMTFTSTVDSTAVVVVRWSAGEQDLTCGGAPMVAPTQHDAAPQPALDAGPAAGTLLGKRYGTADGTVEVLCTKPGAGSLAVGGVPLIVKTAKPLPASD
jgi:hypothetical protein